MRNYIVHIGKVKTELISPFQKIPKKVLKRIAKIEPFSVIDRRGLEVESYRDHLVVKALDIPENRKAVEIWEKIKDFVGKKIIVGSKQDYEYTSLEVKLYESSLGRVLLNVIAINFEPDIETLVSESIKITRLKIKPETFRAIDLYRQIENRAKEVYSF